jgi:hypothetical protein
MVHTTLGPATMSRDREPTERVRDALEGIALRIHQISAAAGVMAASQAEPLSHALFLIEESLLEVEERVNRLWEGLGD